DEWIGSLAAPHQTPFSRPEFLKAAPALSARYGELRAFLHARWPLDSAGKRAAFASFYTPLHLLTTKAIVQALRPAPVERIVDLGCGTGAASGGWALAQTQRPPDILGIDRNGWALTEALWN